MTIKICEQCGEEYKIRPSYAEGRRFCSRKCMGDWRCENGRGGKIKKTCEQCGDSFESPPSKKARFCSRECMYAWRSENQRGENNPLWKDKIIKVCEQCGGEYEIKPSLKETSRFCSRKCMDIWRSENVRGEKHISWKGGKIIKTCEMCGVQYEVIRAYEITSRFCSRACMGKWHSGPDGPGHKRTGEKNHSWKGGVSFDPYCPKFNEPLKESIREKFGRVCFLCGKTEAENGKKLCVHHVNYDKNCLCDGVTCEFVPLCKSCHIKTNHNREYWEKMIMEKLIPL